MPLFLLLLRLCFFYAYLFKLWIRTFAVDNDKFATLAPCVSTGSWLKCVEFVPAATVVLSLLKIIVLHCRFSEIWAKIVLRACLALITCVWSPRHSDRLFYIWPSCTQRLASVWNLLVANRLWTGMIFGSYAQDCLRLCLWLFSFKKYCTPSSLGNLNSKFYWQVYVIFEHQQLLDLWPLLEAAFARNLYWQPFLQVVIVFKSKDQHCCSFAVWWPWTEVVVLK